MVFNTNGYFMREIQALHLPVSDAASVYLSRLFERMIQISNFYPVNSSQKLIDRPFGLYYLELLEAEAHASEFQQLGDSVLFYSTGFKEKIKAQGISLDYLHQIGAASYLRAFHKQRTKILALMELAEKFPLLSEKLEPVFGN